MTRKIFTFASSFNRFLLSAAALFLALIILLQATFLSGIVWIGTPTGQKWAEQAINTIGSTFGVSVRFSSIGYHGGQGFYARDLIIVNDDGSMIEADNIHLNISFLPLLVRHLSISIVAETIIIHPQVKSVQVEKSDNSSINLEGFIFPDLMITSVSLDYLNIRNLYIKSHNNNESISLSPTIRGSLVCSGNNILSWRMRLSLDYLSPPNKSIPRYVDMHGTIDTSIPSLALHQFHAQAPLYDISGELTASLPLSVQGRIYAIFPTLVEKGLSPVLLSVNVNDEEGEILLSGTYQNAPLSLHSPLKADGKNIFFDNIILDTPSLSGTGKIEMNLSTSLVNGNIAININELNDYADLFGTGISGRGDIILDIAEKNSKQSVDLNASLSGLKFSDISVHTLQADIHIPDISLKIPDHLSLYARELNVTPQIYFETFNADIVPQEEFYQLNMNGKGRYHAPFAIKATANLHNALTITPSAHYIKATISTQRTDLILSGMIDTKEIDMTVRTDDFLLDVLSTSLPAVFPDLSLSGDMRLHGPLNAPLATANIHLSSAHPHHKNGNVQATIQGEYINDLLSLSLQGKGSGIDLLEANIFIPASFSLYPFVVTSRDAIPLRGSIVADVNSQSLSSFFRSADHDIHGLLNAKADISGVLLKPTFDGTISLEQGYYRYEPYGISLNDISLSAVLSGEKISLTNLSAYDGDKGRITGKGYYNLSGNGMINLAIDQYHLLRSEMADGVVNGHLNMTASNHKIDINGDIDLGPMTITIPERFSENIPELNIVKPGDEANKPDVLKEMFLNIGIGVERFFVRGWGLDAEFDGAIRMNGTLADPQFSGTISTARGRYEEFGRRFDLSKANLRFQGNIPPSPYLDIEATTQASDITASVLLSGSAANPSINFSSSPALPEDEVLAYLLFGRSMSRITPFQAVQLTQTLRRLSGQGSGSGFDPLNTLRSLIGLDDIRVDTNEEGEASIGAGKYLSEDVYLEIESGAGREGGAATLQIELTPHITIESEIGQDARAGGGVLWRYDY